MADKRTKGPENSDKEDCLLITNHKQEKPIASVYREIDTDLARDNLENNIPAADLQDM